MTGAEQSRGPAGNRTSRAASKGQRARTNHTELLRLGLAPRHAGLVSGSGIDPKVVSSRGYKSIADGSDLVGYGFIANQRRAGLLLPIWNVQGEEVTAQLRPDHPRKGANDKPIKYESPKGKANVLDVHPHIQHQIADPNVPLWITEGIRKADSAISRGLCCIALMGVWNWRGKNQLGGTAVLADWESIALKGRDVYVVFDSDVMTKPTVHGALGRLKAFLEGRGAKVRVVYLPAGGLASHTEKAGLDDWLAMGGTVEELLELAVDELRSPDSGEATTAPDDWPVPEGFEVPAPWRATADGISRLKEGVPFAVAHSPVVITGRLVDEDGREAVEVSWLRDDTWRSRVYERDVLYNTRKIIDLAAHGVGVTSANARELATYLSDLEAANMGVLPRKTMVRRLGWVGEDHRDFVCGDRDDVVVMAEGMEGAFSAYRQEGSFEEWRAAVAELKPHPRATLGIYSALAAPLLRLFDVAPFFVDLSGQTSTGKTTALLLGVSVWGHDDLKHSWNATAVAIETKVGSVNGLPTFLDETKLAKSREVVADIVYEVSQGVGRARGAKAGGLRETLRWSTIVVSTGEQPLTTFTQDGGTRARVVGVWGSPFTTEDRDLVLRLNAVASANFGHAGPAFVNALLSRRDDWKGWRNRFEEIADQMAERATNVVGERRARYVALLRFTAGLATELGVMDWKPAKQSWDDLLVSGAGEDDDDQPAIALEEVWYWAVSNREKFWSKRELQRQEPKTGWHGRWSGRPEHDIFFRPDMLKTVLERGGHDYTSVVKAWGDRGWIVKQDGKNTKVVNMLGLSTRMVVIRAAAIQSVVNPAGDDAPVSSTSPPRKPSVKLRIVGQEVGA